MPCRFSVSLRFYWEYYWCQFLELCYFKVCLGRLGLGHLDSWTSRTSEDVGSVPRGCFYIVSV